LDFRFEEIETTHAPSDTIENRNLKIENQNCPSTPGQSSPMPPPRPEKISLIAAMSDNRVIGRDNALPWRLPVDMKYFMTTTRGHTVVMGRKTWESMNGPLKNRRNIVVTRQPGFHPDGAEVAHSIADAVALAAGDGEVFVIGGEEVYRAALQEHLADRLYLTHVHVTVDGDAHFPEFDPAAWKLVSTRHHVPDEQNPLACDFNVYECA
jgi:dihydrofolate reductase